MQRGWIFDACDLLQGCLVVRLHSVFYAANLVRTPRWQTIVSIILDALARKQSHGRIALCNCRMKGESSRALGSKLRFRQNLQSV
jgi:hypothetical protein